MPDRLLGVGGVPQFERGTKIAFDDLRVGLVGALAVSVAPAQSRGAPAPKAKIIAG